MMGKIEFLVYVTGLIFACIILIAGIYDLICRALDRKNEKAEDVAAEAEVEKLFKTWMREVLDERECKQDFAKERKNVGDKLEDEELWQRSEEKSNG